MVIAMILFGGILFFGFLEAMYSNYLITKVKLKELELKKEKEKKND